MKRLLFGTMLMGLVTIVSVPTMAEVAINVNIPLPPPIVFNAPPDVVVLPDTPDVYACPGISVDLFFYDGWWICQWGGAQERAIFL